MPKNLVIVESPSKAKTISKILGNDFQVESCFGHISDLPSKNMGIDIENDFKPQYAVTDDKKEVVKHLKKISKTSEAVWLASDEDREGEAISWHLQNELGLKDEKIKRIVFHEITKKAILEAIEHPRKINKDLVDAQQARRVLDRLVGYQLSPVLWKKVKRGLSAGRVQSVAVRLIVEKEREIEDFEVTDAYRVTAQFVKEDIKFLAILSKQFSTHEEAKSFLESLFNARFEVVNVEKKQATKTPPPPFITSSMQQEASQKLGISVSQTMRAAQKLYESGHITYMRTDSVALSDDAKQAIKSEITSRYGDQYHYGRTYVNKSKNAQEAHECIRPTNFSNHTLSLDYDQSRLYEMIWKRAMASQMADSKIARTILSIGCSDKTEHLFQARGETITFDGFLKLYLTEEKNNSEATLLPSVKEGEEVSVKYIQALQRYSKPPSRYSEASLVKKLEELGIGRPSTYAPTISTIQKRGYVEKRSLDPKEREVDVITLNLEKPHLMSKKELDRYGGEKNRLAPSYEAFVVNDFLIKHFEDILDYQFTAKVEKDFDNISLGKMKWVDSIRSFYRNFSKKVGYVEKNVNRESGEKYLGEDPETGQQITVRLGKFGPLVQKGKSDDENVVYASLLPDQKISKLTLEQALKLFTLPKDLGAYEGESVIVHNGRFGAYIKHKETSVSIPKTEDPLTISLENATELIKEKNEQNKPLIEYKGHNVFKGKGRFGPYIKWNDIFISVTKKYNFDNLSGMDVTELIEDKLIKLKEKVIKEWKEEDIRIEKTRWGRHAIVVSGKKKIELSKEEDVIEYTLEKVKQLLKNIKKK